MYIVMGKPMAQKSESFNGGGQHRWERSQITDLIFWRLIHHICWIHLDKYSGMSGKVAKMAFFLSKSGVKNWKNVNISFKMKVLLNFFQLINFVQANSVDRGYGWSTKKKSDRQLSLGPRPPLKTVFWPLGKRWTWSSL